MITTADCHDYASTFTPTAAHPKASREVELFEEKRKEYLLHILDHAQAKFQDEGAAQKLFEHSLKKVLQVDPYLAGETRYTPSDYLPSKVFKYALYSFRSRMADSKRTQKWLGRYEILSWGRSRDLQMLRRPSLTYIGAASSHFPQTARDHIVKHLCLDHLGFPKEEQEALQALFDLLPGAIESTHFDKKAKTFSIQIERGWVGKLLPEKLDQFFIPIPEEFAPVRDFLDNLRNIGAQIPGILTSAASSLAIFPKTVRLELGSTVSGRFVEDRNTKARELEFDPGRTFRIVIPARFGLSSPDIYLDLLAWGRKEDGTIFFRLSAGASWGSDLLVKSVVMASMKLLFGEATSVATIPSPDEERFELRIPSKSDCKLAQDVLHWE